MMDDLSRPARLPSEAITMPAMETVYRPKVIGNGALGAVRREWPSVQTEQHTIPASWDDARDESARLYEAGVAVKPLTMGRAALQSVLNTTRR